MSAILWSWFSAKWNQSTRSIKAIIIVLLIPAVLAAVIFLILLNYKSLKENAQTLSEDIGIPLQSAVKNSKRKVYLSGAVAYFSGYEPRPTAYAREEVLVTIKQGSDTVAVKNFPKMEVWEIEVLLGNGGRIKPISTFMYLL